MQKEKIINPVNGYLMFAIVLLLVISGIVASIINENISFIVISIAGFILSLGFILVNPNSSKVLLFFGKYVGTVKQNGLFWANPLYKKKTISLRASNFDSERLKVNDKLGNPYNDFYHFSVAGYRNL